MSFSVAICPTSDSNAGSSGLETNSARARESRSMNSKSFVVSSVLAAIGTTPARMQPRNTTGHSGVSSIASITRVSGAKPRSRSALAKRCACSSSWPYVSCAPVVASVHCMLQEQFPGGGR